jgi:hypothetical protein
MKFFKLLTFIVLSSISFLFANDFSVVPVEDGLLIKISNLELKKVRENAKFRIKINDLGLTILNSNSKYNTDEIQIQFVAPTDQPLSYEIHKLNKVNYGFIPLSSTVVNQDKNTNGLKSEISISYLGLQRFANVYSLRIQPLDYDENTTLLSYYRDIELLVKFPPPKTQNKTKSEFNDNIKYYQNIINIDQVPAFATTEKSILDQPQSANWYQSNLQYVRLTTTRDGIAKANLSDVLALVPDWAGKTSSNLHLVYNGEEYPFNFINDDDGKLDAKDFFYFYGRRPSGDTTWFDNYATETSFFIYYSESSAGLRLRSFDPVGIGANELSNVFVRKHIEKEKTYYRGFPQESSNTAPGEGWFWDIISPSKDWPHNLKDSLILIPEGNNNGIKFNFNFASCMWNVNYDTVHQLNGSFNKFNFGERKFAWGNRDSLGGIVPENEIFYGINKFQINSIGQYINSVLMESDHIGIDYYTIEGNFKPFAQNGIFDFSTKNSASNNTVNIPGFRTSNVWAIDTINGLISQMPTKKSDYAIASTSSSKSLSSIVLNSKKPYTSDQRGIHVVYSDVNKSDVISNYFASSSTEAQKLISGLPDSSRICIAINADSQIDNALKTLLKDAGSTKIEGYQPNQNYLAYYIKGGQLTEKYFSASTAELFNSFDSDNGQSVKVNLGLASGKDYSVWVQEENTFETAKTYSVNKTDLRSKSNQYDAVVVYHKLFEKSIPRYLAQRKLSDPDKNIIAIDQDDIYKEFNFGKKSPHAIQNLLKYAFGNWKNTKPTYVVLWGDASWDCRKIQADSKYEDFVPTYGWPASDYWYIVLTDDFLPDMYIGRVPVKTIEESEGYVDKLVLNDTIDNNPWNKKFLFLTGGQNTNEIENFYSYGKYYCAEDIIAHSDFCADTLIIKKELASNTSESQGGQIIRTINSGFFWSYYIGHGSARILDSDGWQVEKLNNKGKYGYLSTLSCNTAAFAEPNLICRNEEYVVTPEKGFIGSGGSSGVSDLTNTMSMGLYMLSSMLLEKNIDTYVEALWYAKEIMHYNVWDTLNAFHYTFLGDPLVKLKIRQRPDFYFMKNDVSILNQLDNRLISVTDSTVIKGFLYNNGLRNFENIKLILIHDYKGILDTTTKIFFGICSPAPFILKINTVNQPGIHKFTLVVDPEKALQDLNYKNNTLVLSSEVFNNGIYPLEPLALWNIDVSATRFRVINPISSNTEFSYSFKIWKDWDTTSLPLFTSSNPDITQNENFIEWKPTFKLEQNKNYILGVQSIQLNNSAISPLNIIPFNTFSNRLNENVDLKISGVDEFIHSGKINNLSIESKNNEDNLVLDKKEHPLKITSIYGGSVKSPYSLGNISIGTIEYTTTPPLDVGFRLVAVSADSFKVYIVKYYNTNGFVDDQGNPNRQSGQMNLLLRDSVKDGDYVLLATNNESFMLFHHYDLIEPGSINSLQALRTILKEYYGAKAIDTMDIDKGSYSFFGRKNKNPEKSIEAVSSTKDTAEIQSTIIENYRQGNYLTDQIGPAKNWKSIKITGNPDSSTIYSLVLGRNIKTNNIDTLKNINHKNLAEFLDISDIDAKTYPFISVLTSFKRENELMTPSISSYDVSFVPAPELAVSKIQSSFLIDSLLRGDDMVYNLKIENINIRSKSDSVDVKVKISSDTKAIEEITLRSPVIQADSSTQMAISRATDSYDHKDYISIKLEEQNRTNELYSFNNSLKDELILKEDTEKPRIEFKLDGKIVTNGDFVSRVPYIEVTLYDNSKLPVTTARSIGIGINRPFPGNYDSLFTTFNREVPLKAKLEFWSDTLDYGENYYRIIVSDASGNRDTNLYYVRVSLNGFIDNLLSQPNPFTEKTNISLNLKAPENKGNLSLQFFNTIGQSVRKYSIPAKVGLNSFEWDGRDETGNTLQSGVYVYVVTYESDTYAEPQHGKCILMK